MNPYIYQINPYEDTIPFHNKDENDVSSEPEYTQIPLHQRQKLKFRFPNDIDTTVELLSYLVFPDSLIDKIVK